MTVAAFQTTLEDFLKLPEEKPALEYFEGVIRQKMSPKTRHAALQGELVSRINAVSRQNRVALALPELRTTYGGSSFVPDVAVYRWSRLPRDTNGALIDDVTTPPDIAIEIASPGQSVNSLVKRCRWYVAHGVGMAILVDPDDRSVLAFLPDGTIREWAGADEIDLGDTVPDPHLTVDELFASLTA